jgi:hypothetical protein
MWGPALRCHLQEAALLASMRHPNVVNFFGICREPPCIITEFCSRGSLAEVLAEARRSPETAGAALTWQRRLTMMLHAAVGMLYLHTPPGHHPSGPEVPQPANGRQLAGQGEWSGQMVWGGGAEGWMAARG